MLTPMSDWRLLAGSGADAGPGIGTRLRLPQRDIVHGQRRDRAPTEAFASLEICPRDRLTRPFQEVSWFLKHPMK